MGTFKVFNSCQQPHYKLQYLHPIVMASKTVDIKSLQYSTLQGLQFRVTKN